MKKQIEKLIKLATAYYEFGMDVPLTMSQHNYVRGVTSLNLFGEKEGTEINIYLADKGETWMVEFDKFKISNFSRKIEMEYNVTEEYLKATYDSAYNYLHNYLLVNVDKFKSSEAELRLIKIKALEIEIARLKNQP